MLRRLIVMLAAAGAAVPALANEGSAKLHELIAQHARANKLPESIVHRVVKRESRYDPRAVGRGGAMGLMQIKHATARALGYRGTPVGLLDAETNLTYAVKYLAGAYRTAGGDPDRTVGYYARGYYYAAKRKGVRLEPEVEQAAAVETSPPPPSDPVMRFFARLANPGRVESAPAAPAVETAQAEPEPVTARKAERRHVRLATQGGAGPAASPQRSAAKRGEAARPASALAFAGDETLPPAAPSTTEKPRPKPAKASVAPPRERVTKVAAAETVDAADRPEVVEAPLPPRREGKLSVPASFALPEPGTAAQGQTPTEVAKAQARSRPVKPAKAGPTREAAAKPPALRTSTDAEDDTPAPSR